MERAFKSGQSQDMVKQTIRKEKPEAAVTVRRLESQKKRLERNIQNMQEKLATLEVEIEKAREEG